VPPGSEMFLSTLTHPDRSFIRVASAGLDQLGLYADPPLAETGNVMPAEIGRIYDYALLDIDESPESYGYRGEDLVWDNQEVALYKRGAGLKVLFRFGIGSERLSISSDETINIELSGGGTIISISNGQLYKAEGTGLRRAAKAQVELLLATEEDRTAVVEYNGVEHVVKLPVGLSVYRTELLSLPAWLRISPNGPVAVLQAVVGDLGDPVAEPLPDTVAVTAVSSLEKGRDALSEITYYGPKDKMTSIGIDVYSTVDKGHYGWWATLTDSTKRDMQMRLDLLAQKGVLTFSDGARANLFSESWPAPNGSYRAFLQVKREEKYYMISAFDFTLDDEKVKDFRPLKIEHIMSGP